MGRIRQRGSFSSGASSVVVLGNGGRTAWREVWRPAGMRKRRWGLVRGTWRRREAAGGEAEPVAAKWRRETAATAAPLLFSRGGSRTVGRDGFAIMEKFRVLNEK